MDMNIYGLATIKHILLETVAEKRAGYLSAVYALMVKGIVFDKNGIIFLKLIFKIYHKAKTKRKVFNHVDVFNCFFLSVAIILCKMILLLPPNVM